MRCYYGVLPKQTSSRYVRTHTRTKTPTTLSRRRRPRLLRKSVNSREVRRSLTWHSSKSESALKRFEPVAVFKPQWDGQGTLFALVAARRQGEFSKRGELTNAHSALVGVAETGGENPLK